MSSSKPRVIKDYERLEADLQEQIKLEYPLGFSRHLISFTNKDGHKVSALPFETEEKYYLVRMTIPQAKSIIANDDDYDDDGVLKDDVKVEYEDKYSAEDDLGLAPDVAVEDDLEDDGFADDFGDEDEGPDDED
ncbi:MAG: hypothetical protein IPL46_26600 [Saprospiraceae bacterium]|nr:hypothetical protein [Saprospiraceae bacterium]